MKCEKVQELFPELQSHPDQHPDAKSHMDHCPSCKTLFHIFKELSDDSPVNVDPVKREVNFINIKKKMRHHDRVVFTRRISSVASAFVLIFVGVFSLNQSTDISIADISDEVLFMQSEANIIPDISMDHEDMIDYLVQYENIETLGELF